MINQGCGGSRRQGTAQGCAAQKRSETLQFVKSGVVVAKSGSIKPSIFVMQTAEDRLRAYPSVRRYAFGNPGLQATGAQPDQECLAPGTDEDVRHCNGSPILEACTSDEIHSAVSRNPNTLDGSFQSIVRRKHWPSAHVPVISTLRYPSSQLAGPNQQRRSCGDREAGTCIPDLPVALPAVVAESTPRLDVRSR